MSPMVSLIVPTFQRRDSIERLILALIQQTLPAQEFEVIVSIDGSEDGTRELVENFRAPFRLQALWQPNQGRAKACNAGIQAARGEVVILLDDDMEPSPQLLEAHCQAHRSQPHLGVIGAAPVRLAPASPPVVRHMGQKFNDHLQRLSQPGHKLVLRDFYSGNFSIRRYVLLEVGLFDETFTVYGNEDLELFDRLRAVGVQVVYSPDALAIQHYEKDFPALARDEISKGRTAVLFVSKHPEAYPETKLAAGKQESPAWRLGRQSLLALSAIWPAAPERVVQGVRYLEKSRFQRMHTVYRFTLDYFFWLGVRDAQNHPVLHR